MESKICSVCNLEKPLSQYYFNIKAKGNYSKKCKDCCRDYVKVRTEKLKENTLWSEREKKRAREKYYRLNYRIKHKPSLEQKRETEKRYNEKYPEKKIAKTASQKLKKINTENELHHWSYNPEHYKDVIELSVTDHAKLHRYIIYDQEFKKYRRDDNWALLDTKEEHLNFFNEIKNKP